MKARNFLIILLGILIILFSISNGSAVNSIDELAYVVAIGFDVGKDSDLIVSFQINMPSSTKEQSSSDSSRTIFCNQYC